MYAVGAMSALFIGLALLPSGHAQQPQKFVVTPPAVIDTKEQPSSTDEKFHPFKQLTQGSTPAGWMQLGTPPRWLKVIFDTGSDKLVAKTWETIEQELMQLDQGIDGMIMPTNLVYNHNASTSYIAKMGKDPLTGQEGPLQSMIAYGSGEAITQEGTETVVVGKRSLSNFSLSEIAQDTLQLLHTAKGISGILGLQHMMNRSMGESIFSKMRDQKLLTSFGYCRGENNTGTFIWGDDSKEGDDIPVIGQMHWAVTLQEVKVHTDDKHAASLADKGKQFPRFPHQPRAAVRTGRNQKHNGHAHSHHQQEVHGWQAVWPFGGPGGQGGVPQDVGGGGWSGSGGAGMGGDAPPSSAGEGGADAGGGYPFDNSGDGDGDAMGGAGDSGDSAGDGDGDGDGFGQPFDAGMDGDGAGPNKEVVIQMGSKHMCNEWNCTAILDTGSNIIAGPSTAINAITAQLNVKNDCSNFDELPPISFKLGGKPVTIHAESYVMKVELPPGMAGVMGGDGDGDGADGDGAGGDGAGADPSGDGAAADQGGDGDGDGFGGAGGGGGCEGGGGGCQRGQGFGGMGGLDFGNKERVGVAMPMPHHNVKIGIPGTHGGPAISISINRHDPEKPMPEGSVRRKVLGEPAALAQTTVRQRNEHHVSATTARWRTLLADMKKHRGIDLSTALRDLLNFENGTDAQFLCMPALVPIDKHTPFGPLWIVGTPFLDEYYGRYSFDHDAGAPKFSFKLLKDAETCKNLDHNKSSPTDTNSELQRMKEASAGAGTKHRSLMRAEQTAGSRPAQPVHASHQQPAKNGRGPTVRKLDEIMYPHWAKSLLKI